MPISQPVMMPGTYQPLILQIFFPAVCIIISKIPKNMGARKLQLCSGSNSIYLNQLLKTAIRDNMFRIMNIDETKLDEIESLSVEFTLSGIVALLSSKEVMDNPLLMLKMPETDIGKVALGALRRLSEEIKGRYINIKLRGDGYDE